MKIIESIKTGFETIGSKIVENKDQIIKVGLGIGGSLLAIGVGAKLYSNLEDCNDEWVEVDIVTDPDCEVETTVEIEAEESEED